MGLIEDVGSGPVCLDTVVFIYFIEENPEFMGVVEPVFKAIDQGTMSAVTSAVTLLEALVVPYRVGDQRLAQRYETILTRSHGIRMLALENPLLRLAAELRASADVRTPDALQLAAALSAGCTAFVTNDRRLPKLPALPILELREYV